MTPAAVQWHLHGEHGISSEAIFDLLTFGATSSRWGSDWPHDPDDFRRCELLLRAVPEFRRRLPEVADHATEWRALIERWDDIAALMEQEAPGVFGRGFGMTPKSYALMCSILDPIREARRAA